MANIAFVTWDGGGNLPPAIGMAQALVARGHGVRFFGYEGQRGRIEAQGLAFSALTRTGDFDKLSAPPAERRAALLRRVWACPEHLDDVPDALAAHPADVLVVDFLMHGALAWSERAHVPVVALAHSAIAGLVPPPESPVGATILGAANALRSSAGLTPLQRLNDAWDRILTLVTTVPELDPAAEGRGPSIRSAASVFRVRARWSQNAVVVKLTSTSGRVSSVAHGDSQVCSGGDFGAQHRAVLKRGERR